jgi:hypothetical protein
MGLFDLGRIVYAQHTIVEDSREASRKGQVSPAYTSAQYQAIRDAGLAQSPGVDLKALDITGEAGTPCPTGDPDPVATTCFYPGGIAAGKKVVVNISVTMPLLTPIISQIVGGSITISSQSVSYIQ